MTDTPKTDKLQPLSLPVALLHTEAFPINHNKTELRKLATSADSQGLCLIKIYRAQYKYMIWPTI